MSYGAPDAAGYWVGVGHAPIPADRALAVLSDERAGGTCLFLGTTRRWTGSAETLLLEFETYREMVVPELTRLADEAQRRWGLTGVVVLHRLGPVPPPDASVLTAAAAPHRAPAFEAARWLIDTLKDHAPIWKRETFADGHSAWASPTSP